MDKLQEFHVNERGPVVDTLTELVPKVNGLIESLAGLHQRLHDEARHRNQMEDAIIGRVEAIENDYKTRAEISEPSAIRAEMRADLADIEVRVARLEQTHTTGGKDE